MTKVRTIRGVFCNYLTSYVLLVGITGGYCVCVDMALVLHNRKCLGRCDPPTGWRSILRGSTVCRNDESKPYASIGNRHAST